MIFLKNERKRNHPSVDSFEYREIHEATHCDQLQNLSWIWKQKNTPLYYECHHHQSLVSTMFGVGGYKNSVYPFQSILSQFIGCIALHIFIYASLAYPSSLVGYQLAKKKLFPQRWCCLLGHVRTIWNESLLLCPILMSLNDLESAHFCFFSPVVTEFHFNRFMAIRCLA